MTETGRDRLRELLDAVVPAAVATPADGRLAGMATTANSSPFHFSRQVAAATGEPPVALRRRVVLERAAWRLQRGTSVTDAAIEAGYESVDGFARAFGRAYGCSPSTFAARGDHGHWLPAPNGLHFHSPTALYVDAGSAPGSASEVLALLVHHDIDDVAVLLEAAAALSESAYREVQMPGNRTLAWAGPVESLADVMRHLVLDKLPWLASIAGDDEPDLDGPDDAVSLAGRHEAIGAAWLALVRDIDRRSGWNDRVIDALCDPPESFLLAEIVAHVVTFAAHLRQLARSMLRAAGIDPIAGALDPDPIMWHRRHTGGAS